MSDPIIEAAAREVYAYDHDPMSWDDATDEARDGYRGLASVMLTAVTPLIRAQVLEEAAQRASDYQWTDQASEPYAEACRDIAARIRALKERP